MKTVKSLLGLKFLGDGSRKEAIWLWLALAVWFPYILTGCVLAGCFSVVMVFPETRKAVLSEKRMFIISVAISTLSALSALTAGNYLGVLISLGIFVILVLGCYLRATVCREIFDKAAAILGLGSISAAISAIAQCISRGNHPLYRPTAGAFNANYYGALVVFSLLLAYVKFMKTDAESGDALVWYHLPKWVWLLIGGINIFALLYCRSRSSLLSFMVCAMIIMILTRKWILVGICAAGFCGVGIVGFIRPDLFNWENTLSFVFEQRVGIWMDAWNGFLSSVRSVLIGRGPMTYYFAKVSDAMHAHNVLFDTLINVGVIGLGLYLALLLDIFRASWESIKKRRGLWVLSVTVLIEILVQGVFDVTIMWLQTGLMFMMLAFPVPDASDTLEPDRDKEENSEQNISE